MPTTKGASYSLSVRVSEFTVPPVADGLVIGKDAPIGFSAISKALSLLTANHMQAIELHDDVIGHIIVRQTILRRTPQDKLVAFILERVKPLMSAHEIMHLNIKSEVVLEDSSV
jgi:hypothetical protein